MKQPSRFSRIATLATVAAAAAALVILPGCGKAGQPGTRAPDKSAGGFGASGTNTTAGARTKLPAEYVSVFDNSAPPGNKGKDPFNPLSHSRDPHTPLPAGPGSAVAPADPQLKLLGVIGSPGRWLAAINNQTLAVKEEAAVRVPGGSVRLTVLEIGSNYADVMVQGSAITKRLVLSQPK